MRLDFFPYELRLRHVFTVSAMSRSVTPDVQVTISHGDYIGFGEASLPPYLGHTVKSVCDFLTWVNLEQFDTPTDVDIILDYVDNLSAGDNPAKAAIDIALHDLIGRMFGAPVYQYYMVDPSRCLPTSYTIGIDTPDVVVTKVREAEPYKILKVKVGRAPSEDKLMINTIRSVTDKPLYVDANQGWHDRDVALEMIQWLYDQGVVLIEQPMPKENLDDLAYLTAHSPIPVIADESVQRSSDMPALKGVFSGVNIKLMKSGGLREAYKMIELARKQDMKVMLGCMTCTSCEVTATAQLMPLADYVDLDGNLLVANDRFEGGVAIKNGLLTLNNDPGLGITIKE